MTEDAGVTSLNPSITFIEIYHEIISDIILPSCTGLGDSVGCLSDWCSEGCGFDACRVGNVLLWRFDHEIYSTVILSLLLIQEGLLSVSGERMCLVLVNHLED